MGQQRTRQVHEDDPHDHDRGLSFDVSTLMNRRRALGLFAIGGLAVVAGCGSSSSGSSATTTASTTAAETTTTATDTTATAVDEIPEETGGPYPADGSNGVNVLTETGIVRSDIRGSFGSASGVAAGVPAGHQPHRARRRQGRHAGHRRRRVPVALRPGGALLALRLGDQRRELPARGAGGGRRRGRSRFSSIYPAAYSGRWPHIHFEVYPDVGDGDRGRRQAA